MRKIVLLDIDGTLIKKNKWGSEKWIGTPETWRQFLESLRFVFSCQGYETVFGICTSRGSFNSEHSTWKLIFSKDNGLGNFIDEKAVFVTNYQGDKLILGLGACELKFKVSSTDVILIDNWGRDLIKSAKCFLDTSSKNSLFSLCYLSIVSSKDLKDYFCVFHAGELSSQRLPLLHKFILNKLLSSEKSNTMDVKMFSAIREKSYPVVESYVAVRRGAVMLHKNWEVFSPVYFDVQYFSVEILSQIFSMIKQDFSEVDSKKLIKAALEKLLTMPVELVKTLFMNFVNLEYGSIYFFVETSSVAELSRILKSGLISVADLDIDLLFGNLIKRKKSEKLGFFLGQGIKPKNISILMDAFKFNPELQKVLGEYTKKEVFVEPALISVSSLLESKDKVADQELVPKHEPSDFTQRVVQLEEKNQRQEELIQRQQEQINTLLATSQKQEEKIDQQQKQLEMQQKQINTLFKLVQQNDTAPEEDIKSSNSGVGLFG